MLGPILNHPERISADLARALLNGAGKGGFPEALGTLSRNRIRGRLHLIDRPTLIVWGEKDRLVPLGDAFRLQSEIEGSKLVIFPDARHLPMVECPDRFNALLAKFSAET